MSNGENKGQQTQHAFLVAWGWFAELIGLPEKCRLPKESVCADKYWTLLGMF